MTTHPELLAYLGSMEFQIMAPWLSQILAQNHLI